MKRITTILFASCLCAATALQAQEYRAPEGVKPVIEPPTLQQPVGAPIQYSPQWLSEQLNPTLRARRQVRQAMEQRAWEQESVIAQPYNNTPTGDLNKSSGLWKATIGNTAVENWSPYPDRALDARTLRFPLPKKANKTQGPKK